MRTVFSNRMVAHVWAQQERLRGKSHNGNLYFEGTTIYSYGPHFPIARFVTNAQGERAVLFTTRNYSPTTSQHKHNVHSAIPGNVPLFNVQHPDDQPAQYTLDEYVRRYDEVMAKAKRARSNAGWLAERGAEIATEGHAFADFFGLPRVDFATAGEALRARIEAERQAREAARAAEERARAEEEQRVSDAWPYMLARWREGAALGDWYVTCELGTAPLVYGCPYDYALRMPVGLRIKPGQPDTVETTRGAEFPLSHALKALPVIRRCRKRGEGWHTNGHRVPLGHFQIDEITAQGDVKAGCHFVEYLQIEAAAALAGAGIALS